jgi:hypothetical protein
MLPIRSQKDLSILCDFGPFLVFSCVRKKTGGHQDCFPLSTRISPTSLLKEVIDLENELGGEGLPCVRYFIFPIFNCSAILN